MRKRLAVGIVLFLGVLLGGTGPVDAETTMSGEIKSDRTWTGKVLITGDVNISGAVVTVAPGAEVIFAPTDPKVHCILSIGRNREDMKAALIISGTKEQPVTWRTKAGSANGAIVQRDTGARFQARYAYFADLGFDKTPAILCESRGDGDRFLVENCAFEECKLVKARAEGRGTVVVRDSRFTRRSFSGGAVELSALKGKALIEGNAVVGSIYGGGNVVRIVENVLIGHSAAIFPGGRDVEVRANIVNVNHDGGYTMLTQSKSYERLRIIDNYFRGSAWQMLGGATGAREVVVRGNVFEGTAYSFHTHEALIMIPAYAKVSRNIFLDYGVAGHPGCDWGSRRRWAYINNVCRSIGIGTASKVPAKTKPLVRGNLFLRTGGVGENIYTTGLVAGNPGGFRADFNCFWETPSCYHPDQGKRRVVHYATGDHESADRHAFVFGKTFRKSPGFGMNDVFPGGPVDQDVDPMVVDPWVNVPFTNEEVFTGKVTIYDLLLAMRSGFAPRPNSPLINSADPRENSGPLVTDGRADVGAVELSSWPAERKRLNGLADGIRFRWKDLKGDVPSLVYRYHTASTDRIKSDFASLMEGTAKAPAAIDIWLPWSAARSGVGKTKPFGSFEVINWLLFMIDGVKDRPALIAEAVKAYEKEPNGAIGIALAHSGDPAAVDFLIDVLKARRADRNRKVQMLAAGLKEGLGLIGREHALKPLVAVSQQVDPEAASRVALLLARFGGKDAASAVVAMHANKRFTRQQKSIARALRYMSGPDAVPVLAAVLKDANADMFLRACSARGLGRIGGEVSEDALVHMLLKGETNSELIQAVAEGLAATGGRTVVPRLKRLYASRPRIDKLVPSRLAYALSCRRDPELVETLCAILKDGGLADYSRVRAAFTLGQLGAAEAVGPLNDVLRGGSSCDVRCAAAAALARIDDKRAVSALGEVLLGAKDENVANACANALGISGRSEGVDVLVAAIDRTNSPLVRNTVALSLGRLGGKKAQRKLVSLLRSKDVSTRACAAEGLELMGGDLDKTAIDALSALATSRTDLDAVKEASALALSGTGSALARPTLEKILVDAAGETIYMRKIASSGLLIRCGTSTPELRRKAAAVEDGTRRNVGNWKVVGPFKLGGEEGWKKARPPETETDFTRAYTVGERQLKWITPRGGHPWGYHRLRKTFPDKQYWTDGLAYAVTRLEISRDTDATVFVEVDDGVRMWLNGVLIADKPLRNDRMGRRIGKQVRFRKGLNELRLKLPQLAGTWGFTVYLALPDGVEYKSISVAR